MEKEIELLKEYAIKANEFAIYEMSDYPYLGLAGEHLEIIGKMAKKKRGDNITDNDLKQEFGDTLWFISEICTVHKLFDLLYINTHISYNNDTAMISDILFYSSQLIKMEADKPSTIVFLSKLLSVTFILMDYHVFNLAECLQMNLDKLNSRKKRNVINGNGDRR